MLSVVAGLALGAGCAVCDSGCPRTVRLLQEGREPVRIVCFGDSIAGVYYHSGAARAWCDMVGIGLKRLYPQAKLEMINAGISSQTSANGLARIQTDVLDRKPTLVVVAFGMNDVRGANPMAAQQSRDNQAQIVRLCKGAGAEVVLCTPTLVYPNCPEWPSERLGPYADMVRQVAAEESVPVADSYRALEELQARDRTAWMLTMSEWIHPNMNGHKIIAQEVIRAVTGRSLSLADVPAPAPGIPFTLARLAKGEPVKVVAMEPYDTIIGDALRAVAPNAQVEVVPWPVPHRSIADIEQSAMSVQGHKPDLVVVAIPAEANAPTEEWFIRHYSETYNYSISYVTREFDCIGILPSVLTPELGPAARRRQDLAREIIRGHDLEPIERKAGDTSSPEQILERWLRAQAAAACKEANQ
jgi:lysophospholipase L1-like esterase